ncbi:hypothetical protein CEY00_Acc17416 [Actinidia chinensis var. chinensis]|uniref:Uncharacterized protein n=1 Tax=Actinidia chinensis var. chinensis TaxID=1590841 RepID=A0A2R6QLP4_ACTCC|nr:hypothetical protein CEY00_Acc17416 [Actinidia chinensis var. chinensis]
MAFYSSNFYEGDTGEYYGTSYSTSYDIVPFHDSISHSSYEFSEPRFVEYDSTAYSDAYDPFLTRSESSYPTYNVTEPKLIEYDSIPYEMQYAISHSSYEFSEPRSVEYNSTAYSNAYDPFLTPSEISYSSYSVTEPKLIEYNPIPYETQYLTSHSSYEFSEPRFIEYKSSAYSDAYDPFLTRSEVSYSTYSVTEPKLIESNPIPYETQYAISYSTTTALDDTELTDDIKFVEYDLTPYGGGYDPTLTYGKPLAPSDEICYPRSSPVSSGLSPINFSTIPSPYGKHDVNEHVAKPSNEINPTKSAKENEQQPNGGTDDIEHATKSAKEDEQQPKGGTDKIGHDRGHESLPEKPLDSSRGKPEVNTCDDNYPWSGYGNEDCGSRYGYGTQLPQTPCGYGLDAVDLCESLFGYWPCLDRLKREQCGRQRVVGCEQRPENQWMGAAYYLLYGDPTCNCGRH